MAYVQSVCIGYNIRLLLLSNICYLEQYQTHQIYKTFEIDPFIIVLAEKVPIQNLFSIRLFNNIDLILNFIGPARELRILGECIDIGTRYIRSHTVRCHRQLDNHLIVHEYDHDQSCRLDAKRFICIIMHDNA